MSNGIAVEVDRRVVGVAVRVPGGFKFFSSDPAFSPLEAKVFRRVESICRRLAQLGRSRRRGRGFGPSGQN
jgi:hypothetical protein